MEANMRAVVDDFKSDLFRWFADSLPSYVWKMATPAAKERYGAPNGAASPQARMQWCADVLIASSCSRPTVTLLDVIQGEDKAFVEFALYLLFAGYRSSSLLPNDHELQARVPHLVVGNLLASDDRLLAACLLAARE